MTEQELADELIAHGFYLQKSDMSWRDPEHNPVAFVETLRDICECWPSLVSRFLAIMLDGFTAEIKMSYDGYKTTVILQPSIVYLSETDTFCRPVILQSAVNKEPKFKRLQPLDQLAQEGQ